MKLHLQIDQSDIAAAQQIVEQMQYHRVVQERLDTNVAGKPPIADDEKIWHTFMICLLTSQQRSDDDSPIGLVLNERPFRLALGKCRQNPKQVVCQILKAARGIRFAEKISGLAASNLEKLDSGEWTTLRTKEQALREQIGNLPLPEHYVHERQAARYMQKTFHGFGPKQSRNFWQILGLTRYEFVLDSRVMNWLQELGPSIVVPSSALSDEEFYVWLSDKLREELCVPAGILPCVLDAAVFSRPQPKRKQKKITSGD